MTPYRQYKAHVIEKNDRSHTVKSNKEKRRSRKIGPGSIERRQIQM